jgi:hypothetical protein
MPNYKKQWKPNQNSTTNAALSESYFFYQLIQDFPLIFVISRSHDIRHDDTQHNSKYRTKILWPSRVLPSSTIWMTLHQHIMRLVYTIVLQNMTEYFKISCTKHLIKCLRMMHHLHSLSLTKKKLFDNLASATQLGAAKNQNLLAAISHSFQTNYILFYVTNC